jgi:hypothetical protein
MKNFPSVYSEGLKNFVTYLLVIDPKKRPSFHKMSNYQILDDEIGKF